MADQPVDPGLPRAPEGSPLAGPGAPAVGGGSAPTPAEGRPDPLSAMTPRFNLLFRSFARRFFRHFDLDDATVARLQALEKRGAGVYVMRYTSRREY